MAVDTADITQLARVAKALSDPIRLKMVAMLAEGRDCCDLPDLCTRNIPGQGAPAGICVCEFQEQFDLGQSRTSYHLRVLKDAGLVTEETRGKWTFYQLDNEAMKAAMLALHGLAGMEGPAPTDVSPSRTGSFAMRDESICTELGCMTPAQVVECAERANTECWIAATVTAEDGSEVEYECCGGGGKKARFRLLKRGAPPRQVSPAEVPSSLTWIRRMA